MSTLDWRLLAFHCSLWLALSSRCAQPAHAEPGDDHYAFSQHGSQLTRIRLRTHALGKALGLTRAQLGGADTVLLGVRVASLGSTPRVRIRLGTESIEQHLDPAAHGLRWLNLSSLRVGAQPRAQLVLELRDAAITNDDAMLRRFTNRIAEKARLLILAPHPDDAEIAAFGLYASQPERVTIATITAGNAGPVSYRAQFPGDSAAHYRFKGFLRAVDSVTVPWQGGVRPERCVNLGYFDARLATMYEQQPATVSESFSDNHDVLPYRRANLSPLLSQEPRSNSWPNLVADLRALLQRLSPEIVVLPHPLLDSHPDHQFVAVAAVEAFATAAPNITFLLYTNHAGKNEYPYGPAGGVVSLPPWRGADMPVDGLYALPLSPALQRRKLFALDSMHDLRLSPDEQIHCTARARDADSPRHPSMDYFRRGPRSEELFFVADLRGLRELVQRYLQTRTP